MSLTEALARNPELRAKLALDLQEEGYRWRQRRTDEFSAVEIRAVRHALTIQGLLEPSFLTELAQRHVTANIHAEYGERVNLYIPLVRKPKRLLLDVNAHAADGTLLPIVPRYADSPIIAEGIARRLAIDRQDERLGDLIRLLEALAAQNPMNLIYEIDAWWRERVAPGKTPDEKRFGIRSPLSRDRLEQWLWWKLDQTDAELKDALLPRLHLLLDDACDEGSPLAFGSVVEIGRSPLTAFRTVDQLLLCGIGPVLRVASDRFRGPISSHAPNNGETKAETKAAAVAARVSVGLSYLRELVEAADKLAPGETISDLADELEYWTPLVPAPVSLGNEFILRLHERLPLGPPHRLPGERRSGPLRELFRRSGQAYPLQFRDAQSLHVEVHLSEPELRIPLRRTTFGPFRQLCIEGVQLRKTGDVIRRQRLTLPTTALFEGEARTSPTAVHFYGSYGESEVRVLDECNNPTLVVPIKLAPLIHGGFLIFTSALWIAAVFIGNEAWRSWQNLHALPRYLTPALTLGALSITVSLWVIQYQVTNPLLARKLRFYRGLIVLALVATVISAGLLVYETVHGGPKRQTAPCAVPFTGREGACS